jgi:anti-sigma regulatory factor (Ser/Thr protein kinase)
VASANDQFEISVDGTPALQAARHTLRQRLEAWGCANVDDVVLVFSELATNAAVHTERASRTVITHESSAVRLAVHDSSHTAPLLRTGGGPGGWGLRIVSSLSDSFGWEQTDVGKTVWSVIGCGHSSFTSLAQPVTSNGH